ncbi:MAG TPA: RedB protein [Thermoanaerobaculia bacterium]|nr:RedB protein [Thermoanaerobaculia bacterium]
MVPSAEALSNRGPAAARWLIAGSLWLLAVAGGFGVLLRYASTPAPQDDAPPGQWPAATALTRSDDRSQLLLFAHPHCPCTRASVAELARLMGRFHDRLDARVLVVQPPGAGDGWADSALRERASAIPGVRVSIDGDGVEARRFGAIASGTVLVYDASGRLLFHGGITASRGHEGQSFGQQRIASLLTTGKADSDQAPVFGCVLFDGETSRARRQPHVDS